MKKNSKALLTLAFGLSTLALTSCGDSRIPRTFTVNFDTGETGQKIASQTVKEGYMVQGVTVPTNSREALFRGWYTDKEYTEAFDIETYRVFEDITLYARWVFPNDDVQEIALGDDAFSHTVTWVQKGIKGNEDKVQVKAYVGTLIYTYSYDANLDKNVVSGTSIEYDETQEVSLTGTTRVLNDYEVSFTVDNPENKYYMITISASDGSFKSATLKDLHFKGTGTEDNPYLVYSSTDLEYLSTHSFDENTYVEVKADVTLKSIYNSKTSCVFNGHISGSKSNELIKTTETYTITLKNNSGLFFTLGEKGTVKDLSFAGSISGSNPSIGVVANYSYGTITNVDSKAVSVKSDGGKVNDYSTFEEGGSGGIVGTNYGLIKDCTVESARDNVIQGNIAVGGVAGVNYGTITDMRDDAIVGAYNGNEISLTIANSYAGVVAGINFGTISMVDVYNGKINTRRYDDGEEGEGSNCVGGVAGYNAKDGLIDQCSFDGMRIVGDTNVGGIAGYNDGEISNCYTGRRLRKPSNTAVVERQFISPVIGSYNVGGIAGKCGENSNIHNVFSTANVWSYRMPGYTIAEKANNSIGINTNTSPRESTTYLGQKYGVVYSEELIAPIGTNDLIIDATNFIGRGASWGLGFEYNESGVLVKNLEHIKQYLEILGDKFGFRDSEAHGIRLRYESSSVKSYDSLFGSQTSGNEGD